MKKLLKKIFISGMAIFLISVLSPNLHPEDSRDKKALERKDNIFGTLDENMQMGRDKESGDIHMRITPPPRPEQPKQTLPPVIIRPELNHPDSEKTNAN